LKDLAEEEPLPPPPPLPEEDLPVVPVDGEQATDQDLDHTNASDDVQTDDIV